ncbi:MAG: DUF84 family protein [Candidatus Moranbacteria bacterium]|nr:DUF84 family protein [Candidatus Moranbacteria bacterium]
MQRIILGSTSRHKIEAVRAACEKVGLAADVSGFPAESGQDAQPVGYDATRSGAYARASQARDSEPTAIAIGIESGIDLDGDSWYDFAIVIVLIPDRPDPIEVESVRFGFPAEYATEAKRLGFGTNTIGNVIAARCGCDPTDPHSYLSSGKTSRSELLGDAIVKALDRIPRA